MSKSKKKKKDIPESFLYREDIVTCPVCSGFGELATADKKQKIITCYKCRGARVIKREK